MKPVRVTGVVVLCQSIQVCILCAFCVCVVYYVQHVCVYVCVASSSGSPIFSAGERGREEEKERGGEREEISVLAKRACKFMQASTKEST